MSTATPTSKFRLAVTYSQAGLLDAAEHELEALRQLNPSSPTVAALLTELQQLRR